MKPKNSLKINFIGDVYSGGEFEIYRKKRHLTCSYPFDRVTPFLTETDLLILNFEGPIIAGHEKRPDVAVHLNNDPAILTFLKKLNRCVLNISNNHIMDFGSASLARTREILKKEEIPFLGAGLDRGEAWQELRLEIKGKKIALLAFSTAEKNVRAVIAGPGSPGCASLQEREAVLEKTGKLKQNADLVIISLHWGYEYHSYPSYEQKEFAHALVDAGADIIYGHHPHVVQGIEQYRGALIMYSLGNFFFPPVRNTSGRLHYQKPPTKEFMVIETEITAENSIRYNFQGGRLAGGFILRPYRKKQQARFAEKINLFSDLLKHRNYENFWNRYRKSRAKSLLREKFSEVFIKLFTLPPREYLLTFKPRDIIRNLRHAAKAPRK